MTSFDVIRSLPTLSTAFTSGKSLIREIIPIEYSLIFEIEYTPDEANITGGNGDRGVYTSSFVERCHFWAFQMLSKNFWNFEVVSLSIHEDMINVFNFDSIKRVFVWNLGTSYLNGYLIMFNNSLLISNRYPLRLYNDLEMREIHIIKFSVHLRFFVYYSSLFVPIFRANGLEAKKTRRVNKWTWGPSHLPSLILW